MSTARIFITLIAIPLLVVAYLTIGAAFLVNGAAQWREAGAQIAVAEQKTEQTRIEWDGRVAIAEIEADATKKTSFAFAAFWGLRAATWLATIAAIIVAGLLACAKLAKAAQ